MRRAIALSLGTILLLLGLPGLGQAQSSVQIQGTIQTVDCRAQIIVLSGFGTSNTVMAAPYTAVLVNSTSVPFCTLQQYVGAPATAWLVASGSEFVATRIDVVGQRAAAPAAIPVAVVPAPPLVIVAPVFPVAIVPATVVVVGFAVPVIRPIFQPAIVPFVVQSIFQPAIIPFVVRPVFRHTILPSPIVRPVFQSFSPIGRPAVQWPR